MGNFLFGVLLGYVAFSSDGIRMTKTVKRNLISKVKEGATDDRHESMDREGAVSEGVEPSVSRSHVSQ